jgi:hypothetical protein
MVEISGLCICMVAGIDLLSDGRPVVRHVNEVMYK